MNPTKVEQVLAACEAGFVLPAEVDVLPAQAGDRPGHVPPGRRGAAARRGERRRGRPGDDEEITADTLRAGRVRIFQPARGARMSLDPVLLEGFLPPPHGRFLDIGCGTGRAVVPAAGARSGRARRRRRAAAAPGGAGRARARRERLAASGWRSSTATCGTRSTGDRLGAASVRSGRDQPAVPDAGRQPPAARRRARARAPGDRAGAGRVGRLRGARGASGRAGRGDLPGRARRRSARGAARARSRPRAASSRASRARASPRRACSWRRSGGGGAGRSSIEPPLVLHAAGARYTPEVRAPARRRVAGVRSTPCGACCWQRVDRWRWVRRRLDGDDGIGWQRRARRRSAPGAARDDGRGRNDGHRRPGDRLVGLLAVHARRRLERGRVGQARRRRPTRAR